MSFTIGLALVAAAGFADLDAIDRQVADFTGAPIGQQGGASTPVDRRLRLRSCMSPLTLSWNGVRRDSVLVQCPDAGGWRVFVPVRGTMGGALAVPVVNRGDAVTIAVQGDGFSVSQPGEALEGGAVGSWIRVRSVAVSAQANRSTSDAMRAQIVRPGLVALPLP
ncbi:MAG TPA: flagella basal body P-ring formation protein FlgA [Novosphingobium sp.]